MPKARQMTPAEFTAIREGLGLSKTRLARVLRMGAEGRKTIGLWESGDSVRGIPGPAQIAMLALKSGWRNRGMKLPCDERKSQ